MVSLCLPNQLTLRHQAIKTLSMISRITPCHTDLWSTGNHTRTQTRVNVLVSSKLAYAALLKGYLSLQATLSVSFVTQSVYSLLPVTDDIFHFVKFPRRPWQGPFVLVPHTTLPQLLGFPQSRWRNLTASGVIIFSWPGLNLAIDLNLDKHAR